MAIGDKMPKITFDYALISGGAFVAGATQVTFERTRAYLHHYFDDKEPKHSGKREQVTHSYLRLELQTSLLEFDIVNDANANTKWLYFQKWLGAPVRRMAWDTTTFATCGGYSQFNSASNTNYVRIVSWEPDYTPSPWVASLAQPQYRLFRLVVEMVDEFTIT